MVIEPLGSVMTLQGQSQAVVKHAEERPAAKNMEVSAFEQAANVDATTLSVAKTERQEDGEADTGSKEQQQTANDKIKKAVEQLNKSMPHSEAVFGIHDETNRVTIKIINRDTKEVIKEIPPEKTLDMIAKVWELAGMLVDEKR